MSIIDNANSSFDVAHVVYELYKTKYYITNKNNWHIYNEETDTWVVSKNPFHISTILSTEVSLKFLERGTYWAKEAIDSADENYIKECIKLSKNCNEISIKLRCNGYKSSVIKHCKMLFFSQK